MRELLKKYKENRVELSVEQIINILIISVATIMPYIVSRTMKPSYLMGKVYYLYIIGIILCVLAIKNYRMKFLKEEKIFLVFLGSIFISFIFSTFKDVAFWGNYFRREGLLMFCIYGLLFLLSIKYLNLSKKVLKFILFLPNIMAIYSIFEFYGDRTLKKFLLINSLNTPFMGFIGNRNFYATYLVIFLVANFSIYILKGKKENLLNSSIQFSALICSLTRSGWVAFFIISLIGIVFIYKDKNMIKRAIVSFLIFSSIFVMLNITSNNKLSDRVDTLVESTTKLDKSSGSGRIFIWQIVGDLIYKNPVIGEGPDTLRESINLYIPERMAEFEKTSGVQIDKAHNEYLEYWASCGILTLISYVLLLILIGKNLLKRINNTKFKILFLIFCAYITQAFFNISVPMVAPIWWIFLGLCIKEYRSSIEN